MMTFESFNILLKEGLITTYPLKKSLSILEREIGNIPYWYSIEKDDENNKFSIEFDGVLNINELIYLTYICNNQLGYFCSAYCLTKNKMIKNFIWKNEQEYLLNIKNCNKVKFIFESKFDEILKHHPNVIYHVTEEKHLNKIQRIGLIPKSKSKKSFHTDRIYITLHLNLAQKIMNKFIFNNNLNNIKIQYVILEIDLSDSYYNDIKIYKDPNMIGGYYIYDNIRPNDIKVIF